MRLRIFIEPQMGATYDQQLAVALLAEAEGFDALFRSDHYLTMGGDGLPGPTDSWVTLAGLARETSSIRLGTMVTSATFRHPGPLAISVAQVDAMSGGRVELGIGAGWYREEHEAYAIPFPPTPERFERLTEQLEILTGLWDAPAGGTFSHRGAHYTVLDSPGLPKPVQDPRPPIIVGGVGKARTPALAARFADEYNTPFTRPERSRELFAGVRRACEAAGRDPDGLTCSSAVTVCVGTDEAEVAHRAGRIGRSVEDLRADGACGTPAQVAARLREWADAGASVAYLQVLDIDDLDHIRLIGREVAPRLRG